MKNNITIVVGLLCSIPMAGITIDHRVSSPSFSHAINSSATMLQAGMITAANTVEHATQALHTAIHGISHRIHGISQSCITSSKIAGVMSVCMTSTILGLFLMKKGIEKTIAETDTDNKKSYVQHIKNMNKKGIILSIAGLATAISSFILMMNSEHVVNYFAPTVE